MRHLENGPVAGITASLRHRRPAAGAGALGGDNSVLQSGVHFPPDVPGRRRV